MRMSNLVQSGDVLEIYTDGAARGNPGQAACAYVFVRDGEVIYQEALYLGEVTNNQAEYQALINALDKAIEFSRWDVKVYSDSQLLTNQMNKRWRVKHPVIKRLYRESVDKEKGFQKIEYL